MLKLLTFLIFKEIEMKTVLIFYLFSPEFDLEVFGTFLCDPATEVQLIYLAVLIPERSFVVHDEVSFSGEAGTAADAITTLLRLVRAHFPQLDGQKFKICYFQ